MQRYPEHADALLQALSDKTLHHFDDKASSDLAMAAILRGYQGVRVRAPAQVDLAAQDELPVIQLRSSTTLRAWEVLPRRNTALVAVDAASGAVRCGGCYPSAKREVPTRSQDPATRPTSEDGPSPMADADALPARDLLKLPWRAGALHLTVLYYDWPSNTVTARLGAGAAPPAPLSAAESLSAAKLPAALPAGITVLSSARASGGADTSITVGASKPDPRHLWISGEVKLPLPAGGVVATPGGGVAGVVRGALLFLRRDSPTPAQVDLAIPVPGAAALPAGVPVQARFAVDLGPAALRPGETLLYLVVGPAIAGPLRLTP